jgi:transcription antitermination factor NusG
MWRCIRFLEHFKGLRTIDEKGTDRILKKISEGLKPYGVVITDYLAPGVYLQNKALMGILYLEYDEKYDDIVILTLKYNGIFSSQKIEEEDVLSVRRKTIQEKPQLKNGMRVNIINGMYKGLVGYIEKIDTTNNSANVLIEIFGQDKNIDIPLDDMVNAE